MAVFKDPIAPKKGVSKLKAPTGLKSPQYDRRTSSSVAAGDNYGVGFKNPIGKERASSFGSSEVIPKKAKSFKPDQVV